MKLRLLLIFSLFSLENYAQGIIVNPDGTHSVVSGSVVINSNGTHSTISGSTIINPNGTVSTISGSSVIGSNGSVSTFIKPFEQKNDSSPFTFSTTETRRSSYRTGRFELTSAGFADKTNPSAKYIKLDYPRMSKHELYSTCIRYFRNNPSRQKGLILSAIENESITIDATESRKKITGHPDRMTLDYSVTLEFKDGQLRILSPALNNIKVSNDTQSATIVLTGDGNQKAVFNENGNLKLKQLKVTLDNTIKTALDQIDNYLRGTD